MSSSRQSDQPRWNFDIDQHINPFILPSRVVASRLPVVVRRWLGLREHAPSPLGSLLVIAWAFIGTVGSLSLIHVVCRQIITPTGPVMLGSFGAAAVLEFYAIDSPLSQPRNMFTGQLISSVIGVGVGKGLSHISSAQQMELRWLAGTLSCACSIVTMGLTGSVHPPAGATALLAVTDDSVVAMGWLLVPVVMVSCVLMFAVALVTNNVQRSFPASWWSPGEVGSFWADAEGSEASAHNDAARGCSSEDGDGGEKIIFGSDPAKARRESGSSGSKDSNLVLGKGMGDVEAVVIAISTRGLSIPAGLHLTVEQRSCLEELQHQLRHAAG